ncbi:MAG: iron-containing alcohol dehydrogenase [Oscillospiraceae bacterium]|jgi:glycerol dehydrogenase|nr:iron-containing alcohol dehydrogenase [Oscillospiraceae bacterium]
MILGDTVRFSAYTVGAGAMDALAKALAGRRVAIVTGEKSWAAAEGRMPPLDRCALLRYGGECTMAAIADTAAKAQAAGADAVLGVGGGKALDVAKGAAARLGLLVYAVPTIAATCAAVTALSVVYHEDGALDQFLLLDRPPEQAFLDTELLARAPARYFRAGLADAMAKHLECTLAQRGQAVRYVSGLGADISRSIFTPLLQTGAQAYRDCQAGQATDALADALQRMIVSVGMTSLLVDEAHNGAVAHSVCYGLGALPGVEGRVLHGELVGYGCLVQLALDQDMERLSALRAFLQAIGSPVSLKEMAIPADAEALTPALRATLAGPDMETLPYPVDEAMLLAAMAVVEAQ